MYVERQNELLQQWSGKIIAVKDGVCLGDYPTKLDAVRAMQKRGLKNREFLVILCSPGNSEYTTYIRQ